jgi:hypothetical protein
MGLFDRFRKRPATPQSPVAVSLEQLCYDIAYFILPHYAFNELSKVTDLCLKSPEAAGPYYLVMASVRRNLEPTIEDAKKLQWHHGDLSGGIEYFVLQYPTPRPIDFTGAPLAKFQEARDGLPVIVMAPYFSAVVVKEGQAEAEYFVLGQAPMGGGTTLRTIRRDGANCNLGPGPEPELPLFLEAIRKPPGPIAATMGPRISPET